MGRKKDIFDRMMELPGLRAFQPIYGKYREARSEERRVGKEC